MLVDWYERYQDRGLIVATLLVENLAGDPPSVEELQTWVEDFDVPHIVLSDPQWGVIESYSERGTPALPAHTLIAPGMEILVASGKIEEEDLEQVLP